MNDAPNPPDAQEPMPAIALEPPAVPDAATAPPPTPAVAPPASPAGQVRPIPVWASLLVIVLCLGGGGWIMHWYVTTDALTHDSKLLDPATAPPDTDLRQAMGAAYVEMLASDRDYLMLQLHAYAACDDEEIREPVRAAYARLVAHVESLWDASPEEIDDFFRYGMWLNVAAALGVEDLSAGCEWMRAEQADAATDPKITAARD